MNQVIAILSSFFDIHATTILQEPTNYATPSMAATDALDFFSTWILRIGGIIAFIGALKFALSIKNDDSKETLQALLIMVSGFMIVSAMNDLSIFKIPTGAYTDAAATLEFQSIMKFIGKWARRVGAVGMFIGATMFGFSIKDNNAAAKVTSAKTMAAGAIAMSVSFLLPTFV